MDNREISDTVMQLCANNGYSCLDLYSGLIDYARTEGRTLDEYFFAGCHPNNTGYLAVWRLIAHGLELNLPLTQTYDRDSELSALTDIGCDRSEITEQTNLTDVHADSDIFPVGISIYAVSSPFISDIPYGGTIVTRRYDDNAGHQIFKPFYYSYDLIRYAGTDGVFGSWSITNRDQYYKED